MVPLSQSPGYLLVGGGVTRQEGYGMGREMLVLATVNNSTADEVMNPIGIALGQGVNV